MPHIHEKIDFTAEVFIVYNNKVLLRKHDKYGIWLGVGGHVELDEDPNQAAIREVKEEVGLDVVLANDLLPHSTQTGDYLELIPPKYLNRHRINSTHEHIGMTFFARAATDKFSNQEGEESPDMGWFNVQELDTLELSDYVRRCAKQALKELHT